MDQAVASTSPRGSKADRRYALGRHVEGEVVGEHGELAVRDEEAGPEGIHGTWRRPVIDAKQRRYAVTSSSVSALL